MNTKIKHKLFVFLPKNFFRKRRGRVAEAQALRALRPRPLRGRGDFLHSYPPCVDAV